MTLHCLLLLCLLCLARTETDSIVLPLSYGRTPSVDVKAECPRMRIAIVNGVKFHFEILSGLLHVLRPYQKYVDVFLGPYIRTQNYDGAWDLVRFSRAKFYKTDVNLNTHNMTYDLVILVSPEYELELSQKMVAAMKPRLLVTIIHNGNHEHLQQLVDMAPPEHSELLALGPHVAATLAASSGRKADWMLSVYPIKLLDTDCLKTLEEGHVLGICMRGFSMQGKFSNLRRNYSSIWGQMVAREEDLADPRVGKYFHLSVLGKGPNRLALPASLEQYVTVHQRQVYSAFYGIIAHTIALVPSLANPKYFTERFSSTIITSLNTGTPIMATPQLLRAYSYLNRDAVFHQGADEDEVDTMIRISKMAPKDILAVRGKLAQLREEFNNRSWSMLEGYIRRVCGAGALSHIKAGGFPELE